MSGGPQTRRREGASGPPRRRRATSDLGARLLVAIPAIVVALLLIYEGGLPFALFVMVLGLLALHELFQMTAAAHPSRLAGFIGLIALVFAAQYGDQFNVVFVLMALVPVLFALTLVQSDTTRPTATMSVTMLGVWWIGLAVAHVLLLQKLPHGDSVIVDILAGTFFGDTVAYFAGRLFGRRPLAPSISPHKTLEGLAGGVVGALVAVQVAGLYQDWMSGLDALWLGLGVAIAAPVGDLFESYIKRDMGAKDTGRIFGAHGGALDRLDAALFSLVVGYYIWFAIS